jgi:hypothetical protein
MWLRATVTYSLPQRKTRTPPVRLVECFQTKVRTSTSTSADFVPCMVHLPPSSTVRANVNGVRSHSANIVSTRRPVNTDSLGLTISKVQTRRIQTFNLPFTPSTSSSSTPSHQHLLAGFLQNNSNFWAIPTALLFAKSPLTSVLSLARARLQMTALFGSPARWPH